MESLNEIERMVVRSIEIIETAQAEQRPFTAAEGGELIVMILRSEELMTAVRQESEAFLQSRPRFIERVNVAVRTLRVQRRVRRLGEVLERAQIGRS